MSRSLPAAALAALILVAGAAGPQALAPTERVYRLRPERSRQRLDVLVRPGERLRLEAGGCFRSADPPEPLLGRGPAEPRGLVFIPGVTMTFVPLAGLVGQDLVVSPGLEYPVEPRIWLDWGAYYASPLEAPEIPPPAEPCRTSLAEPYLDVHIRTGSATRVAERGSLTLDLDRYDVNLFPFNPTWAGRATVDACATCGGFGLEELPDGSFRLPAVHSPRCTLQWPYVDSGECRPHPNECTSDPRDTRLSGHVNWGPATYTGLVSTLRGKPVHVARDGDAGLYLEPDGGAGLTRQRPRSKWAGVIGLEFSTPETVMWFRTPWWRRFPFRRFNYRPFRSVLTKLHRHGGSKDDDPAFRGLPATVIGIFGLDTVHSFHPELHPIYAIAIRTEAGAARQVWQVFARSWGTEGDCSGQNDHRLATRRMAIPLSAAAGGEPWRAANGVFFDHGHEFTDWRLYSGGPTPTLVVELPDRPCSVVEGQLTLDRQAPDSGPHLVDASPPVSEPVRLNVVPGRDQLCVRQPWFRPVDASAAREPD
jgi:hypothetical protein